MRYGFRESSDQELSYTENSGLASFQSADPEVLTEEIQVLRLWTFTEIS